MPSAATTSAAPIPSPTPTPAAVLWAGQLCTSMDRVKGSVSSLGRNLSYDVTADRSALEQIQRQLTVQMLAVGDATQRLLTTLTAVPADFTAAAELVDTLTKAGGDTQAAVSAVQGHLSAATSAGDVLTAVSEVGQAVIAAAAAFEAGQAFVGAIGSATSDANAQLREAMDSAPQCQSS